MNQYRYASTDHVELHAYSLLTCSRLTDGASSDIVAAAMIVYMWVCVCGCGCDDVVRAGAHKFKLI